MRVDKDGKATSPVAGHKTLAQIWYWALWSPPLVTAIFFITFGPTQTGEVTDWPATLVKFSISLLVPIFIRVGHIVSLMSKQVTQIDDIHKKITEPKDTMTFESFLDARETVWDEIKRASIDNNKISIQILGITAYHWQLVVKELNRLKNNRNIRLDFTFLVIDPEWPEIYDCHPDWKDQVLTNTKLIQHFIASEMPNDWTMAVGYYRAKPQLWGILINDSVLFYCFTSWKNGRLEIDDNPMNIVRRDGTAFAEGRISAFRSWLGSLWEQNTLSGSSTARKP